MIQNINNNLEKKLNEFIEKNVTISLDGFLKAIYYIHKFKYFIEYEILNITDEKSNNYLKINLNQIYEVKINEKYVELYLDNDIIIYLMT